MFVMLKRRDSTEEVVVIPTYSVVLVWLVWFVSNNFVNKIINNLICVLDYQVRHSLIEKKNKGNSVIGSQHSPVWGVYDVSFVTYTVATVGLNHPRSQCCTWVWLYCPQFLTSVMIGVIPTQVFQWKFRNVKPQPKSVVLKFVLKSLKIKEYMTQFLNLLGPEEEKIIEWVSCYLL